MFYLLKGDYRDLGVCFFKAWGLVFNRPGGKRRGAEDTGLPLRKMVRFRVI